MTRRWFRGWPAVRAAVLALAIVGLVSCGSDGITVGDVAEPDTIPPRDARLAAGGWEETAAWIRRENAAGRPVLLNVLASWCGPCRRELPLLLDAYEDHPEIAFLGIDHLDARADAERFVEEMDIDFPTIFDLEGEVAYAIEGRGMPTTVMFNTDGDVVAHHTGELTEERLEELFDAVE